jgi:Chaperone of endosialidase
VTTGNNNIHIANAGTSADDALIGIGGTQTATFIAGIRGVTTGANDALAVLIDSNGQLGTTNSSRRVKTDIHDLADHSRALHQLRPVSFRYRSHPSDGPPEYGLIAEEVAEIYPELVVLDKDGQPAGVRYHVLPAMLLNEVQKQHAQLREQTVRLDAQQREIGRAYGHRCVRSSVEGRPLGNERPFPTHHHLGRCAAPGRTCPEARMLRGWLDSWAGVGQVVESMHDLGYDVRLTWSPFVWWARFVPYTEARP